MALPSFHAAHGGPQGKLALVGESRREGDFLNGMKMKAGQNQRDRPSQFWGREGWTCQEHASDLSLKPECYAGKSTQLFVDMRAWF